MPVSTPRGADVKNAEDHVRRMLEFKQRCPSVEFDLAPNEFSARLPGVDEPFCSMSLRGLMDRLERWEAEQETSRLGLA